MLSKKTIIGISLMLIMTTAMFADVVTIGTGTSTQRQPFGMWFGYERSAALYLGSEIGVSGNITDLGWYIATLTSHANGPVKIYLKTTSATTLTAVTWADMISGATLLYDQSATFVAGDWQTFNLSSSFSYSNSDNLLVLVETNYDGSGGEGSGGKAIRYTTTATYQHLNWYQDGSAPTGTGYTSYNRPNIQITISTGPPPTNDIGVQSILTPGAKSLVNVPITITAKIKNFGTASQSSFNVCCSVVGTLTGFLYTNTQTVPVLASGRDTVLNFGSFTPTTTQMCTVYVRNLLSDEYPANDRKTKGCDVTSYITIGTGTSGSSTGLMYCYNQYSVTEKIYLQREIGYYGDITNIAFYKTSGTNVDPIEGVSIYMKHTAESTLATGSWDLTDYTLVSSGVFTNDAETGWMDVALSPSFPYNNDDNLKVLVVRDGTPITTGYPSYAYTTTTLYQNRYNYGATQPTSLTQTTSRTNVRFALTVQTPPANDVGVKQILSPGASLFIADSIRPIAKIKNYGSGNQTGFNVVCSIVNSAKAFLYTNTQTISLVAGDTVTVKFGAYKHSTAENVTTIIRTSLSDAVPANDRKTVITNINNYITIGTGTTGSSFYLMYCYNAYAGSEAIYTQPEIGFYGDITNIAYYKTAGTNVSPIESVAIFMRHTSATTMVTGAWDTVGYTRVFTGAFTNNATTGWMDVALNTSFRYNNADNLQVLFMKWYSAITSGYPSYQYTTMADNKNRYAYGTTIPTSLSATTYRPNARLSLTPQTPPANDVGVQSILSPSATISMRSPITSVWAKVKNYGSAPQINIPVCCSISDGAKSTVYFDQETIPSLASLDTITVTLNIWTPSGAGTYTVKMNTFLSGDADPTNDVKTRQTEVVPAYMTGGPDAGDMRWVDSDAPSGPVYNWRDIYSTGTTMTLASGTWDDGYGEIPIGFTFNFYDNNYTSIFASTNGFLAFGTGYNTLTNARIPTTDTPNNMICPLWDDLHCTLLGNRVKYQTLGTTPNCTLVVSYDSIFYYSTGDTSLRFQVLLCEGSNNIIIQYADVITGNTAKDEGISATVGIENIDGTVGLQYFFNDTFPGNRLSAGRAIKFYELIFGNDVGVQSILAPTATQGVNAPVIPSAVVKNYGTSAQASFKAYCQIVGPGKVVRYSDSADVAPLASGEIDTIEFPSWIPLDVELDTVVIWTALVGDEYPDDDLKSSTTDVIVMVDAAVTAITRPFGTKESEHTRIPFEPQVTVNNNGSQNELDVPVIAEIYQLADKPSDATITTSQTFTIDPMSTDMVGNVTTRVKNYDKSRSIDYSVLWAIPITGYTLALGVTPVCIGDYPAGETLLWVSHGGADQTVTTDNGVLIYNLNTRTLVDQFTQPSNSGWGWRDMCFYNGYVYAGWEGYFNKIDPVTHAVVGTYTVTGGPSPLRAMTDNDMDDSLFSANWGSNIYKFPITGGTPRQITQTRQIYGLAYDAAHGCVWGSTQDAASDLVKYSYPDFTPLDSCLLPEIGSGIAGGIEMWGNKILYLSQALVDSVLCIGFPTPVYRDSVSVSVNYGKASVPATFKPCTLMSEGSYFFTSYTKLAGDMVPGNNTMNRDFSATPPTLTLSSPLSGTTTGNNKPTFVWNPIDGVVELYKIEVDTSPAFPAPLFGGTLSETEIESDELADETYYWRVRVETPGTPDPWSDVWNLTISTAPPGWTQKEPISDLVKVIKDGGAMVGVPGSGKTGAKLYALLGSKTSQFKKYTIGSGLGWEYNPNDSMIFGHKYKAATYTVDTVKFNKKYPGKGAALCYDGTSNIYATKGNGTNEFFAYDLLSDAGWTAKAFVPTLKGLKGGTSIRWYDGKVYLLAGGQKKDNPNNFYSYEPSADTIGGAPWTALGGIPLGPDTKVFKDGSSIVELGGTIYAIHGGAKTNLFYAYDWGTDTWLDKEPMPLEDSLFGKWKAKILVKDGATAVSGNGVIYATKGGQTTPLWKYTPNAILPDTGLWERLDPMPIIKENKKHLPKTGAAMAFLNAKVWLLTGNKQPDFWVYNPMADAMARPNPSSTTVTSVMVDKTITTHIFSFDVTPNPFSKLTTIRYTVPISGKVSVKLYNASGKLIETLVNDNLNVGTYSMNLSANKFAKGVYFVKYESDTNRSELKLIVQ